ncbi:MAG: dihydroorotase [Acidiferrobacterales bacterium]|nr:dihydroorotase [Acidiferrobacterales bacterium]
MRLLIQGGRIIDPQNQIDLTGDIAIEDGCILTVGATPSGFSPDNVIDATDKWVIPGVIDLCTRLREPGEEQTATIASETKAAASAGITRVVCPPDTYPVIDTPAMANMIRDRADSSGFSHVHPLGALTVGLRGEKLTDMAMLMDAGCVGVSNGLNAVENTLVMRRALQYASTYDIPVFLTPQDPWLTGNGVVHEGEVSTRLGLPAIPEAAETVGVARDLAVIETSGARAHINLLSCGRSVTMVAEARSHGLAVTSSVAIHQLLLCESDIGAFDTQYKVFPPLREASDRTTLLNGVRDEVITVICSDHQPHGADVKLAPFSEAAAGIAGMETLLPLTLELARQGHFDISTAVATLTCNPAAIIGIDAGHLSVGAEADICIYDPEQIWELQQHEMVSRGKNTPFLNRKIAGRAVATLLRGELIFLRD